MRRYSKDLLAILALLILPLLLFWDVTIGGQTMLPVDNLFQWQPWAAYAAQFGVTQPQNSLLSDLMIQNYAWKQFAVESLRNGEIPLWNPNIFAGQPFLANGQHSMYYPFSWLFFILPIHAAFGWFTVIQLWLAGVGGWFFGRNLKLSTPAAALLGLVYQGSGFMLVSAAVFPMIIAAAVWLPFMLAAIERIVVGQWRQVHEAFGNKIQAGSEQLRAKAQAEASSGSPPTRPNKIYPIIDRLLSEASNVDYSPPPTKHPALPWFALGAIALGLNILAGHPEITYYVLLITGLYAAWRMTTHVIGPSVFATHYNLTRYLLKTSAWLLGMVAIGIMLGAVQLLPAFELASTNFREGGATLTQIRDWAFPLRRVLTLVLPNFFGNPAHHAYTNILTGETVPFTLNYYGNPNPHGAGSSSWGIKNYVEGGIYLGILPLILVLFNLSGKWKVKSEKQKGFRSLISSFFLHPSSFFVFLAFISINFIFGSPLYAVLYRLPFINQLHSPFRWVFALSISVATLAAFGLNNILHKRRSHASVRPSDAPLANVKQSPLAKRRRALLRSNWLALLITIAGAVALFGTLASRLFYTQLEPTIERLFVPIAQAPDAFDSALAFYSYLFPQLLTLSIVLLLSGIALCLLNWQLKIDHLPLTVFFLFALIITDLFLANRNFHTANDPTLLSFKPDMVSWLEQQPGQWRITSFAPKDKAFNANSGWLYGFEDIRGYDSIINRQYTNYMGLIEQQDELKFNRIQPIKNLEALNSPLLDLLGVKYVITSEDIGALPKFAQAWEGEGVRIYENLGVMPRAFTLPATAGFDAGDGLTFAADRDPRFTAFVEGVDAGSLGGVGDSAEFQPLTITSYTNNQVLIDVQVEQASWLILNDSYADGWNAFIRPFGGTENDEQSLDVVRTNGNFRGVYIDDAGAYTVRLRYSPRSFIVGGLTSAMGGVILLFAAIVWGWRRFYQPQGDLSNTQSIAKNSLAPMALNLFNKAIDFLFALFYLRILGPGDNGKYAAAISVALWFDIVANWGLDALIIRDGARDKSRIGNYLFNTTILRLATMLIGIIPVALFVGEAFINGDGYPRDVLLALGLISVGMIFSGVGKGLTGVFYVFESAEYPATLATITTILKVAFGVIVLLLGYSFVGLAAVSIVTNIITLSLLAWLAFRKFPIHGPYSVDRPLLANAFRVGWPLMLNHLLATVFFKIDQPLLLRLGGDNAAEQVGWYNTAYKWVDALNIIPSFLTFALFPLISRQASENINDARRTFRMAIKLLVLIALPLAATITLLADLMIGTLGGQEFLPHGAISLRIVIWSIPIGWINSVTNYAIISLGLEKRLTFGFIVGVLFNTIGNILLIPRYGYVAAGLTTVASELILLLMFNYYLRQRMPGIFWLGLLWRPIVVTAAMLAALLLGNLLNLWLGLLLGLAVYAGGLWLLGVIGDEERSILAQILPASIATRLRLVSP